jgi:hypothetical protein
MEYKIHDVRSLNLNKKGSTRELRTLYNRIKNSFNEQCKNQVSYNYLIDILIYVDYIIYAIQDEQVKGFLLLQHYVKEKDASITILCSNARQGRKLLQITETFAHDKLKCNTLSLSAIDSAYNFYVKKHKNLDFLPTNNPCKKKPTINKYNPEKGINKRKYGNGGWRLTKCIVDKLPEKPSKLKKIGKKIFSPLRRVRS